MLSIIIPTLNEEKYLPGLLDSIRNQGYLDYKIIIADAGSKDNTLKIAKNHDCIITKGGLPAVGKNKGAEKARGDILLFLDADTILPEGFLKNSITEIEKRNLGIAGVKIIPFEGNVFTKLLFWIFYNIPALLTEKVLAHTAVAIFAKTSVFKDLKGFNKSIVLAEDHDFGRRASKISKFGILKSTLILTSVRRFKKDGWIKTYFKYLFTEIYMIFKGPMETAIVKYDFGHYNEKNK